MQLNSVSIKNFRVIKSSSITFPDGVIGIIGPNGAGKSSIIEAIAWALYGNNAARSAKEEIRSTYASRADSVEVELAFTIHGEHYRVVRRLLGKSERPEVLLFRSGKSESVGSMETQKHITRLLGLDWRGFLTSFLARQQELNALSDLAPGKRREHLAGMLGIDRLDRALSMVKDETRQSNEKSAILRQQLSEKDRLADRIKEIALALARLEITRTEAEGAWKATAGQVDELADKLAKAREQKIECSRLEADIKREHQACQQVRELVDQLKREHEELQSMAKELIPIEKELTDLPETKAELEREHERISRQELYQELTKQIKVISSELTKSKNDLAENQSSQKLSQSQLEEIEPGIENIAKKSIESLEAARDQFSQARADRELSSREQKRLTDQLDAIDQIGPDAVCDRCQRPYGPDLQEVRRHLENDLEEVKTELSEKEKQLSLIKAEGEKLRQKNEQIQIKSLQKVQLENDIRLFISTAEQLSQKIDDLSRQDRELSARIDSLGEIVSDPEKFQTLKKRLESLTELQRRSDQIGGRLKRMPEVEKNIKTRKLSETEFLQNLKRAQAELAALGFDPSAFEELEKSHTAGLAKLESEKAALVEASTELDVARKELTLRGEQLENFKKLEIDLEEAVDTHYYGEKLQSLFTDFRKHLIARIRPRLAGISSNLMQEMTADRYTQIELDADYNMKIMDVGQLFTIDRYSGGEKDLANLCLRLAISQSLTESAGLERSFVILDEVFGSQDDDRRDLIFRGLANLRTHFPQMFLVTHVAEIKNKVEVLIEVDRPLGGSSEVKVGGVVV